MFSPPAPKPLPTIGITSISLYNLTGVRLTLTARGQAPYDKKGVYACHDILRVMIKDSALKKIAVQDKARVNMIDCNDGAPSDDFRFHSNNFIFGNSLTYKRDSVSIPIKVVDFDNNTYASRFEDSDGIAHKMPSASFFLMPVETDLIIFITSPQTAPELHYALLSAFPLL